jgi:hypothetical protein
MKIGLMFPINTMILDTDTVVNIPRDRGISRDAHNFHIVHLYDVDEEIELDILQESNRPFKSLCGNLELSRWCKWICKYYSVL